MYNQLFRSVFNTGSINSGTQESSGLRVIDYRAAAEVVNSTKTSKRKHYYLWTEKGRFSIGKYAAENGYVDAVKKLKKKSLNESAARGFAKLYNQEIKDAAKEKRDPKKAWALMQRGWPLLLGVLNEMIQSFWWQLVTGVDLFQEL